MEQSVIETDFADLNLVARGKVRDIYDLGDALLLVATDRLSAFDVVLPDPIPRKGKVLNQISLYWFDVMKPIIANHVISGDVADYPAICQPYADILKERSMLVIKAKPLSIECIVRGYISGSGWNDYRKNGSVCGIQLPAGLTESERLSEPIFTPSTKAEMGSHDINIDFKTAAGEIGEGLADKVKDVSLAIYKKGAALALEKGLIIADTKFEFGIKDDELILIDEVLTPDSSRFWPQDSYLSGGAQKSYDKQYVRDYLLSVKWDKKPPAPSLPQEVIDNTQAKYSEALNRLTSDTDAV
ncbi:phosphoribosylaminoimidazolesuccinocarboxamide synthase [Desulfococcaceae bacterium HSG7]|nr:phosphoribosylaminoimidazolesuccinocarboxamide synthase [Desulfococcaceae bacterium HSG7]